MKIGWIIYGGKRVPGARIQGHNMHEYFLDKRIDSEIIWAPVGCETNFHFSKKQINNFLKKQYDIIVLHKFQKGENFHYFVEQAHKKGIKLIYIGLDDMNIDFAVQCDAIIVVSKQLRLEIPKEHRKKVFVVFDSYEHDGKKFKKHNEKKKIKLVWLGTGVTTSKLHQIDYLPERVSLTVISFSREMLKNLKKWGIIETDKPFRETSYNFDYVEWNLKTVEKEILKCDVAIIPYKQDHWKRVYAKRKSSNRLVLFMSLGLPTIVSPTLEYKPLIEQDKNGFIAHKPEEWMKYIEYLRDNPKVRARIGKRARKDVVPKYSREAQGELYLKIFKKLLKD